MDTNKSISQERAEAVAKFLGKDLRKAKIEAIGFGYEKPISSNKTEQGRAQNRRVDIVISAQ